MNNERYAWEISPSLLALILVQVWLLKNHEAPWENYTKLHIAKYFLHAIRVCLDTVYC